MERTEVWDSDWRNYRWRVGRSLGRTLYVQAGREASKDDPLIGMVETMEIAEYIVTIHNLHLADR